MQISIRLHGVGQNGDDDAVANVKGMSPLDAAYHTAHGYPGGVRALAARIGMSPNVLQNKVNPNQESHHLTLAEAVTLMDVTDSDAILLAMAAHRGYDLIRTLPANTDSLEALYWQYAAKHAELLEAVTNAATSRHGVTKNALRNVAATAADATAHANNLVAALAARVPSPPAA